MSGFGIRSVPMIQPRILLTWHKHFKHTKFSNNLTTNNKNKWEIGVVEIPHHVTNIPIINPLGGSFTYTCPKETQNREDKLPFISKLIHNVSNPYGDINIPPTSFKAESPKKEKKINK